MANPFKPTAGMTPPVLIGREDDLEEFEMALDNGVGDLGRLAYVTGPAASVRPLCSTHMEILHETGNGMSSTKQPIRGSLIGSSKHSPTPKQRYAR